jgi:hypothetical protein
MQKEEKKRQMTCHYTNVIQILFDTISFSLSLSRSNLYIFFVVSLSFFFPICQPQDRRILTTFGVAATARGTLMKMNDLWMA